MVLVAAVVFLLATVVFGRGEELAPLPPGSSPTRLPAADVTADDVARVRFQLTLRGYKMSEVDWVIARLGSEIDTLRGRVAELESGTATMYRTSSGEASARHSKPDSGREEQQ